MADDSELISLTADITASFVANNKVDAEEVGKLIQSVHDALAKLGQQPEEAAPEKPQPAVPIKKSVQPDFIVDLFTGKKLKMLKRYLATRHNMSPADYRTYWGLPASYPMVAPNYSESRKTLAKAIGLGRKSDTTSGSDGADSAAAAQQDEAAPAPKTRGRRKAAPAEASAAEAKPARKPRAKKTAEPAA